MPYKVQPYFSNEVSASRQQYYQHLRGVERFKARARSFTCPLSRILPRIPRGATHLDIGCGTGVLLAAAVMERNTVSVGCEVSRKAAAKAADLVRTACSAPGRVVPSVLQTMKPEQWPARQFQVVTIIDVLHHVSASERTTFLASAAQHLEPGGILIFKDIAFTPRWKRAMNTLHDLVLARQLVSYMRLDEVIGLLERNGLELEETERFNVLWYANEIAVLRRPERNTMETNPDAAT